MRQVDNKLLEVYFGTERVTSLGDDDVALSTRVQCVTF